MLIDSYQVNSVVGLIGEKHLEFKFLASLTRRLGTKWGTLVTLCTLSTRDMGRMNRCQEIYPCAISKRTAVADAPPARRSGQPYGNYEYGKIGKSMTTGIRTAQSFHRFTETSRPPECILDCPYTSLT